MVEHSNVVIALPQKIKSHTYIGVSVCVGVKLSQNEMSHECTLPPQ